MAVHVLLGEPSDGHFTSEACDTAAPRFSHLFVVMGLCSLDSAPARAFATRWRARDEAESDLPDPD